MSVGQRIAEERKRLGFSQAKFAELVGVSLSSQKRYESGERAPDISYLESMRHIDVETSYVMTGIKKNSNKSLYGDHLYDLGLAITSLLNISPDELRLTVAKASAMLENSKYGELPLTRVNETVEFFNEMFLINASELIDAKIAEKFQASKEPSNALDTELLCEILNRLEEFQAEHNLLLEAKKKANVIAMLYRIFNKNGKIDSAILKDTVKLALS